MRVLGAILIVVGLLLCLSIFGAFIGIPMIFIGTVVLVIGVIAGRRTVINNIVQVSNNGPSPQLSMDNDHGFNQRSREGEPLILSGFTETRLQSVESQPAIPQISKVPEFEFEPVYEDEKFADVKKDLTQASKRILGLAKEDGYSITPRPESIRIRKGEDEDVLDSNHAVEEFGRAHGYF